MQQFLVNLNYQHAQNTQVYKQTQEVLQPIRQLLRTNYTPCWFTLYRNDMKKHILILFEKRKKEKMYRIVRNIIPLALEELDAEKHVLQDKINIFIPCYTIQFSISFIITEQPNSKTMKIFSRKQCYYVLLQNIILFYKT